MAKTKTKIKLKVRIPHVVIDARNADHEILEAMAPGLSELEAHIRIVGASVQGLAQAFSVEEGMEEAHIWVILGDKLPNEFPFLVEHGIVPVMLKGIHPEAENYSAAKEKGNAFLFPKLSEWYVYGTLVRALENFGFSYDWNNLKSEVKNLV